MAALVVSIRFQDGADLSPFLRLLLLLLLHWLRLSTFDGGRKTAALFLSAHFKMAPIIPLPPSSPPPPPPLATSLNVRWGKEED